MHQDGHTALMRAVYHGHVGIVTLLLDRGANIDLADKVGAVSVRIALWRTCLRGERGERRGQGREQRRKEGREQ